MDVFNAIREGKIGRTNVIQTADIQTSGEVSRSTGNNNLVVSRNNLTLLSGNANRAPLDR